MRSGKGLAERKRFWPFSIFNILVEYRVSYKYATNQKKIPTPKTEEPEKKLTIRYLLYTMKTFRKPNEQLFPQ